MLKLIGVVFRVNGRFLGGRLIFLVLELFLLLIAQLFIIMRVITVTVTLVKELTLDILEMLSCIILILLVDAGLRGFIKTA